MCAMMVSISNKSCAQGINTSSQYLFNPFSINPAAAGIQSGHQVFANFRAQWVDFPTAPVTKSISYNGQFGKNGLGFGFSNDRAGALEYNNFNAAYSYNLSLNDNSQLAIGISAQLRRFQVRVEEDMLEDVDLADPVVADGLNGVNNLDFSTGVFYTHTNGLYAGMSAPTLIQSKFGGNANISGDFNDVAPFYYGLVGYKIKSKNITFDPSVLVRKETGSPFQIELNARAWLLNDVLMAGISYRTGENTVVPMFGLNIENTFQLYYSFDASFNSLSNYHRGSNELTLGLTFGQKEVAEPVTE